MKQITCPHCADTYPDFDVAHVCSKGPYAPKLKPKMNERIRELAEQAGEWYMNNSKEFPSPQEWNEKFAELLIQQCIEQCSKALFEYTGQPSVTHNYAVGLCQDNIKEHFGVEE